MLEMAGPAGTELAIVSVAKLTAVIQPSRPRTPPAPSSLRCKRAKETSDMTSARIATINQPMFIRPSRLDAPTSSSRSPFRA